MNPQIISWFSFILLILFHAPIGSCYTGELYQTCGNNFTCGDTIANIGYPFRAVLDPLYCGHPSLVLNCDDHNNVTNIDIMDVKYRVLKIDQNAQTMMIARDDITEGTCPSEKVNTTLDYSVFDYESSCKNFTFLYGCPFIPGLNHIPCGKDFVYVIPGNTGPGICNSSVIVPGTTDGEERGPVNSTGLDRALHEGFPIKWKVDNKACSDCTESKGRCGYDFERRQTVCYCTNPPYITETCNMDNSTATSLPTPDITLPPKPQGTAMPPPPLSLLITLTALLFTAASSQSAATYSNCHLAFSCGAISNVTFPFSGGDRPSYCGLPEFALTCRDNTITELTHDSVAYRVLELDQIQKTLSLSRSDLYNNTCPSRFRNATFNSSLFFYSAAQNEALTLFYGCNTSGMSVRPYNLFSCNSSGLNFTDSYHLIGPVPRDPVLRIIYCSLSISVPMLRAAAVDLMALRLSLGEALMQGFTLSYSVPHERLCSECNRLGGECGFDGVLGQPICICDDRPCPFALTLPPESSPAPFEAGSTRQNTGRNIGLFIAGAVLAGVGLGWLIFYFRQKKKQRAPSQIVGKDIALSPSTKGLLSSPSINFTRSIPSFPSSKSDLGRGDSYFGVQVFNYTDLEQATNNFDPSREIGDGGFGTVYYGVLSDGRIVAVKRLYENNFKRAEQFMNEVEILTRLRHQHLVTLYGCTSRRSRDLLLVYEYVPNGTVADHLHGKRAKLRLLSWPIRLNIAVETADALAYLHKSDIIHRDVKTNNLLLDNDFHIKVADFGLSRLFPSGATHVSTAPQGTPGYVDPEYYQCYHLTEKSDVYSFGVVLIELISSLQAVDTNRHRQDINLSNMAVNKIQNHTLHELVDSSLGFETNSTLRRMVTLIGELAFRCLQQERDMRPSMEEVLEALRGIQNEDLNAHKVEVVDLSMDDDVGLLKGSISPPRSQDSV